MRLTVSDCPATNRINLTGYQYDSAGNMTNDSFHSYTYDAANWLTKVDGGATATYTYLGALRVKKVAGATTTVYVYSGTKPIAEYAGGTLSKEYIYAGSGMLATVAAGGAVTYEHPDHLSIRAESDSSGNLIRSTGHFPFGEAWYETGTASKWQFTTYEQDGESQLDYAMFRAYSSRLGRFMQGDPLAGNLGNPESLDRYTYVLNDPLNNGDPLGLDCVYLSDAGDTVESIDHNSNANECWANGGYWAEGWIGGADWVSINSENNSMWVFSYIGGNLGLSYSTSAFGGSPGGFGDSTQTVDSSLAPAGPQFAIRGPANGSNRGGVSVGYTISVVVPLYYGLGPAFTYTNIPSLNLTCGGGGLGASAGHTFSFGPTVVSTQSAKDILSSWSLSGGYNATPLAGAGGSMNPSGNAGGNTFGVPGASAALTWSKCSGG